MELPVEIAVFATIVLVGLGFVAGLIFAAVPAPPAPSWKHHQAQTRAAAHADAERRLKQRAFELDIRERQLEAAISRYRAEVQATMLGRPRPRSPQMLTESDIKRAPYQQDDNALGMTALGIGMMVNNDSGGARSAPEAGTPSSSDTTSSSDGGGSSGGGD